MTYTDNLFPELPAPGADIAASIAEQIRNASPGAIVQINPHVSIPHPIGPNLMTLLERVQCTGKEAIAWAEAYSFVKDHSQQAPGVPFTGLPSTQA